MIRLALIFVVVGLLPVLPASRLTASLTSSVNAQQQSSPTDFSKFSHSNPNHARLPCLLCHRRENAARPTLPGADNHLPCTGCHAQQFADNNNAMCGICHTDAKSGILKPFPRMKSFRMKFDHSLHQRTPGAGCATCHRPARGGVALSIPAGFNAHTTCYRCHNPQALAGGRDISTCGTCHQLGSYSRTPELAAAFRVNFSHGKHQKLTCNECHRVRAGMPQRRQVTAPQPLHHHARAHSQSCMSCHDGKRAFGGDDFSACARCHTGTLWRF